MSAENNPVRAPDSPPDCPWVPMTSGSAMPENAVLGGGKLKGETTYIGRVFDEDCYIVGTALPSKNTCLYLSRKGEIKSTSSYDILTVQSVNPLEFQRTTLSARLKFISGGNSDILIYCSRVVDGENTYIGWADKKSQSAYIPRDPKDGPNVLKDNYDILIHTLLDRLCVCPRPPNPPPF